MLRERELGGRCRVGNATPCDFRNFRAIVRFAVSLAILRATMSNT
jgi:hypothetical protein